MLVFYIVMEIVFSVILFLSYKGKKNLIGKLLCGLLVLDALAKFTGSFVELPKLLTLAVSYGVVIFAFCFIAQLIRKASVVANDLDNTRNTK